MTRVPRAQRRAFEPAIEPAHDAKARTARDPLVEHEPAHDAKARTARDPLVEPEPAHDAKARAARRRFVEHEPANAAKGERGNAMNGAIQC